MHKKLKNLLRTVSISTCIVLLSNFSVQAATVISWRSHSSANKSKIWTINLNKEVDTSNLQEKIKVIDVEGNSIPINISIDNNNKTLKVSPKSPYDVDDYNLVIDSNIECKDGSPLSNTIKMPFSITDFKLGNERLFEDYYDLLMFKRVGLITNQSGVDSQGLSTIDKLYEDTLIELTALYGPEHGIDGKAQAGKYVKSYVHPKYNIPVYSLYGDTRKPTKDMLENVDILIFDIQDIGSRSYTFKSTLYKCLEAASEFNKEIIVLDRPNPLGGTLVDGPILEDKFSSFVGIDNIPVIHGMTIGELAKFFNRKINANLKVVPMKGYRRNMIFQDTELTWVQTSPYIPNIDAVFAYSATGQGDGTGIRQDDYFTWVGGKGVDSQKFAQLLNESNLPGVEFTPDTRGSQGGVKLKITDYYTFNPAKVGIYTLAYGKILTDYDVPKSGEKIIFFDKIMGTDKIGRLLENNVSPKMIEASYQEDLDNFKNEREKYLIYD